MTDAEPSELAGETTPICGLLPLDRRNLELEGRQVYIEPQGFSTAGGSILLAGQPTYEWAAPDAAGRALLADQNRILGVLLDAGGPREVALPVDWKPSYIRVAPLGEAAWALLMAEVDTTTSLAGGVTRLWYGELEGSEWTSLASVPVPAEGRLFMFNSSELRVVEGRPSWVAAYSDPTGDRLVRFERGPDGAWTRDTLFEGEIEAMSLEGTGEAELVLAVSRLEAEGAGWVHSLSLFALDAGAVAPRRVATVGPDEYIRDPMALHVEGGLALSWIVEWNLADGFHRTAQATILTEQEVVGDPRGPFVLDPFAVQAIPVRLADGSALWVVDHMDPSGAQRIRLLRPGPGGPVEVGSFPNPFTGYFAVAQAVDDEADFIIVGPQFDPEPGHVTVRSLFIRVKNTCR